MMNKLEVLLELPKPDDLVVFEKDIEENKNEDYSVYFEYILLNKVLNNSDAFFKLKTLGLKNTDFVSKDNRELWENIEKSSYEGITKYIVADKYVEEDKQKAIKLIQKIDKISYKKEDFDYAFRILKENSLRRGLINMANIAKRNASDKEMDIKESYIEVISKMLELEQTDDQIQELNGKDALKALQTRVREGLDGNITQGVKTGIKSVDQNIGCFYYSLTNIIVARPGHGKTTFMLNTFLNNIMDDKKPVFITLEMPKEEIMAKIMSIYTQISVFKINNPRLMNSQELETLKIKMRELSQKEFYVIDCVSMNVMELGTILRRYIKKGCEIAYVDYMQLLKTEKNETPDDAVAFMKVFKDLREMIRRVNREGKMALVLAAQAGRKTETRPIEDRIPVMGDIEWSSSIEQDAGLVLGIMNREKYEFEKCEYTETLFLGVSKNRHGNTNRFMVTFSAQTQTVTDYHQIPTVDRWKNETEKANKKLKKKEEK